MKLRATLKQRDLAPHTSHLQVNCSFIIFLFSFGFSSLTVVPIIFAALVVAREIFGAVDRIEIISVFEITSTFRRLRQTEKKISTGFGREV